MSETRPPITAGPIERAFKFLKSTSVSCGGVGVAEDDKATSGTAETVGETAVSGRRVFCGSSCAVKNDTEIKAFFENVHGQTDRVDLMLHSLAFAPREALEGDFVSTTREAFRTAHDVSAYSLVALAREVAPLMTDGGSIVAMTYYGSEKVVPHYNVMGVAKASLEASTRYLAYDLGPKKIRVNCISAGPVQTLAARGISGFTSMLKHYQERAPLKRSCDPAELGATGVFLASDGAAAITGQVIYVDGGYQIMGM